MPHTDIGGMAPALCVIGGVSHRTLTFTLDGLEREGPVTQTPCATVPPKVECATSDAR